MIRTEKQSVRCGSRFVWAQPKTSLVCDANYKRPKTVGSDRVQRPKQITQKGPAMDTYSSRPWHDLSREDQLWLDCWTLNINEENLVYFLQCLDWFQVNGGFKMFRQHDSLSLVGQTESIHFDSNGDVITPIWN
jgi:hypothetical protein